MKKERFIKLFFIISFSFSNVFAQYTITGKVVDKMTDEPLPFVNIFASPSNEGTTSDIEGNFKLNLPKKPNALTFSYVGYKTITLKENLSTNLNISLEESDIMIDEAIVVAKKDRKIPKDTAAIALYRNVVVNKDKNRPSGFDSYEYREQVKIEINFHKIGERFFNVKVLRPFRYMYEFVDTTEHGDKFLPMLFLEKISDVYYEADGKEKNIVQSQYMTGAKNLSATRIVDDLFVSFDLYENVIRAGGKPFPSPFSTGGRLTYAYYLSDSIVENDKKYYRLDFTPVNKQTIAFTGYAWIEDESFALKSIEFKLPSKANINFVNDFYVKQAFSQPDGEKWFMDEEIIQIAGNIRKKKNAKSLLLRKHMLRGDVKINHEIDPSVFEGEKLEFSDSLELRQEDTLWWQKNRVSELNKNQKGMLLMADSLTNTKAYRNLMWLGHLGSTAFLRAGKVEFGRFYNFLSWNDIEGLRPRFGLRTNPKFHEKLQLNAYAAYGFRDREWKYAGSMRVILPKENQKWHMAELSYRRDFTFLGQPLEQQQFTHDNFFLSILRSEPLEKIMFIENMRFFYENEFLNGFITSFHAERNKYFKVDNVFEFNREIAPNQIESFDDFSTTELGINFHIGVKERMFKNNYHRFSAGSEFPIIDINYAIGLKDFAGGDYAYHRFGFTLYQRWVNRLGFTRYTLNGSAVVGDIPYPLMNLPIGNESFYRNQFAFNMMNEFEFANDKFASFWIDHHFDGKIFNRIPGLNFFQLREILILKYMYGHTSQKNINLMEFPEDMTPLNGHYLELGFGIENILKLVRVDFLWRLTQRDNPAVSKFGVRFSISPKL